MKQLAVYYDTASRVSIYNYLQPLLQLPFDIILFGSVFTSQEIYGMMLVIAMNGILVWTTIRTKAH